MRPARVRVIASLGRPFESVEFVLVLILALSIYGEAFPYGVPLVLPVTVLGFVWFAVIKRRLHLPINAGFALLVLCFLLYLAAVIRTSHVYETNSHDVRNAAAVLFFGPLLFAIRSPREFQSFRDKAQVTGAVAGTALAILGLYKFHLMASGAKLELIWVRGYQYPWGTSLTVDYNVYAFAMLCGAVSCLFYAFRFSSLGLKIACILGFCLNLISLSLSGSRRGWVTETLLLIAVLSLTLKSLGLSAFRLSRSPLMLTRIAGVVALAAMSLMLVSKYRPAFIEGKQQTLQSGMKELEVRFSSLADPGESFGSRLSRWELSAQLLNQAPLYKLLFGQGFDYLSEFARRFDVIKKDNATNATVEDYPHNPLISAALYSGITGSVTVAAFLLLALVRYIQHRKADKYFLTLYFASLWFILPAYDSIFSGKVFGLLLLIAWALPNTADLAPTGSTPSWDWSCRGRERIRSSPY